jgi:hypothetical protein
MGRRQCAELSTIVQDTDENTVEYGPNYWKVDSHTDVVEREESNV